MTDMNITELAAPPLRIYVGVTAIHFKAHKDGRIGNNFNIAKFVQYTLQETEYNQRYGRFLPTYRYSTYCEDTGMAYLPRYVLPKLESLLKQYGVPYELIEEPPYEPKPAKLKLKKNVTPRPGQEEIIDFLSDPDLGFQPLSAQTASGKALANGTPVYTPRGWIPIEQLQVGDPVFTHDGSVTRVTGVFPQGERLLYLVIFADGRPIYTDGGHLWTVFINNQKYTYTTKELMGLCKHDPAMDMLELQKNPNVPAIPLYKPAPNHIDHVAGELFMEMLDDTPEEKANLRATPDRELFYISCEENVHEFIRSARAMGHVCGLGEYPTGETCAMLLVDEFNTLAIRSVQETDFYKPCTCIAVDHPSQLFVTKDYVVTHNTFMSIAALTRYCLVAMIVLPLLIPQWYKSIKQFTTCAGSDIYVIQGFGSLKKLWEMYREGYRPKIIIFATRTLLLYATAQNNYEGLPSYQDFQRDFGIGVKIIDEVHLGFNTNVLIDLRSNIKHNIYLSATYGRSNQSGKRIFNTVFPPSVIYGTGRKKKYTVIYPVSYSLGMGATIEDKCRTPKGYNHARYENYILNIPELKNEYLHRVIPLALETFYYNRHQPEYRALVLCQTQKFATAVFTAIKQYSLTHPYTDADKQEHKRSIGLFFSGTTKQDELSKDIVISTVKSCGTGMDLKGLICCINTVSFGSEVLAVQMAGRLREIPGEDTVFVDLWCRDVPSHHRHIYAREKEYANIAKQIIKYTI